MRIKWKERRDGGREGGRREMIKIYKIHVSWFYMEIYEQNEHMQFCFLTSF